MPPLRSTHAPALPAGLVETSPTVRPRPSGARALQTIADGDIELAQQRDRSAFERIYRQRVGPVSRYITSIVRHATRAEDVTAQTFLLAWRDLPRLRRIDRFDAWLFRIAHNQAISEVTRSRPTTSLESAPEPEDEGRFGEPQRELDHASDVESLHHAIAALPEVQRQVLILRYFAELSAGEVARQVGKNEQAVWALTYRALKNLKRSMNEAG